MGKESLHTCPRQSSCIIFLIFYPFGSLIFFVKEMVDFNSNMNIVAETYSDSMVAYIRILSAFVMPMENLTCFFRFEKVPRCSSEV